MADILVRGTDNVGGPESEVFRAANLSKSFGSKIAVNGVDLTLHSGKIHALLGENGAGKSTLISMMTGQYRPDSGTIYVRKRMMQFRTPKDALVAGIGAVHQDFRLVPAFTVTENVVLGTKDSPNKSAENRVLQIAESLHFHLSPSARVSDLVVGQQQQTEIIKMLYRGLDILILDEPTAVLTPAQATQLYEALRTIANLGKTIVFVSHRLSEVAEIADHVTVLRDGKVVADISAAGLNPRDLARLMVGEDVPPPVRVVSDLPRGPIKLQLFAGRSGSGDRRSLKGIDLQLHESEIVGVAGVSGNGQRALADVVAGLESLPGQIRTCTAKCIAYIPEDRLGTGLVGNMSIAANLALRSYRRRDRYNRWWTSLSSLNQYAEPLIDQYQIPAEPRILAAELSGGGQQRVIAARELSREPDLIIACQPTRGLDVLSAESVRQRLLAARERRAAILIISEDLDELIHISDRILVMVAGRFVADLPRADASRGRIGELMIGSTQAQSDET